MRINALGFDLKALSGINENLQNDKQAYTGLGNESLAFEALTKMIDQLRCPTTFGINGGIYGAAADLVLACDYRMGVAESKPLIPAAKYPFASIQRFVAKVSSMAKAVGTGNRKAISDERPVLIFT